MVGNSRCRTSGSFPNRATASLCCSSLSSIVVVVGYPRCSCQSQTASAPGPGAASTLAHIGIAVLPTVNCTCVLPSFRPTTPSVILATAVAKKKLAYHTETAP